MTQVKLLLTGAAGFVGTAILAAALELHPEWEIIVSDIVTEKSWRDRLRDSYFPPSLPEGTRTTVTLKDIDSHEVRYIQLDVQDPTACSNAVRVSGANVVIHGAGVVPGGMPRYDGRNANTVYALNVDGTKNMLAACREGKSNVKAFVQTSSCTVLSDDLDYEYPNMPESLPLPPVGRALLYGTTKGQAERLVLAANDPANGFITTALRPSTICGENDYQLIPAVQACIPKFETPFIIGTGNNLYDMTYVGNVADGHILAVENVLGLPRSAFALPLTEQDAKDGKAPSAAGLAINITNDAPITFRDFCLAIWAEFDHVPPFAVCVPKRLAWFAGLCAELATRVTGGQTTLCRGSVKDATGTRYADLTIARRVLGYRVRVPMWEGIRVSCDALKVRMARNEVVIRDGRK